MRTRFVPPKEEKIETQQEAPKLLVQEEEKIFKLAHDIAKKEKEESKNTSESLANQEKTSQVNKEE